MQHLKEAVKRGEMTPETALLEMLDRVEYDEDRADHQSAAYNSRTGRWFRSTNARKRYNTARKGN